MKLNRFAGYAWGVLAYNILVILWGAFVRASGSGAGCGSHWPLCNGEVVPWSPPIETMIEFTHRLTSGVALITIIVLLVWAFRAYPARHRVRLGASLSMLFMIVEALVGAALVLFELVAYDASTARAVIAGVHLINTYILLTVLTLTAWWASGGLPLRLKNRSWFSWAIGIGFLGILLMGASGGIAALGNTLFPAESVAEGLREDFSSTAHFLIRLRVAHPVIAIFLGAYIILVMSLFNNDRATPLTARLAKFFLALYSIQLVGGALNIALLAPVWMQLFHLFMSDLVLITFVLFTATAFAQKNVSQDEALSQPAAHTGEKAYG